jgi:hypothetical protein
MISQHITKLKKRPLLLLVVHQGCRASKKHFKSNGFIQVHNGRLEQHRTNYNECTAPSK